MAGIALFATRCHVDRYRATKDESTAEGCNENMCPWASNDRGRPCLNIPFFYFERCWFLGMVLVLYSIFHPVSVMLCLIDQENNKIEGQVAGLLIEILSCHSSAASLFIG